ncbi:MAG: imidazolonepropionase [Thermoplasmata archaeon]|nr:imidazolonepropionase [Thermoplasmata archaeon]
MIRADHLIVGLSEVATLTSGPIPRTGPAMRKLSLIDRAAVAFDEGRFVFVGTERGARREVRVRSTGTEWDAAGAVAVPGLVDAHTHVLFAGDRHDELALKIGGASYSEIAAKGGGMYSTVEATRKASAASLLAQTDRRLARMASSGTTSLEVKSGYALTHAGELRLLELIPRIGRSLGLRVVPTFLGAHAIPREFTARADAYIDLLVRRTLPVVARRGLAAFCDVFCEPGFFSAEQSERLLSAASALGLGTKIHAEEFVVSGGAAVAARLGVRSADHLIEATETDRLALARAGVTAVLLPATPVASFTSKRSPGRELVDAGVPVALGTDLSPNSWIESMPLVLSFASYLARLTPAEALTAATVNAAHAIGLSAESGQVALGRSADLAVFDAGSVEGIGYRWGAVPVRVYRQGKLIPSR